MKIRTLYFLTTVIIISAVSMLCTISEDNGNPVDTGPGNQPDYESGDTLSAPGLYAVAESSYIKLDDTLQINVTVTRDSSEANAVAFNNALVTARTSSGWISRDSLSTDSNGRATFYYTDSTEGIREIELSSYGTSQTLRINVTNTPDNIQQSIRIWPDSATLSADDESFTTIYVSVINESHNPVVGEAVQFISTKGIISGDNPPSTSYPGQSITNGSGIATATLRSVSINDTAFISAYLLSDRSKIAETKVAFQGVTVNIKADSTNISEGGKILVTITLLDGSDRPVPDKPVFYSLGRESESNFSIVEETDTTGFDGKSYLYVKANDAGSDSLIVKGAGASSSLTLNVSDLILTADVFPDVIQALAGDTAVLQGIFLEKDSTPINNKTIRAIRHYKSKNETAVSDTFTTKTGSSGEYSITLPSLSYDARINISITGIKSSTETATAKAELSVMSTRHIIAQALPTLLPADGTSRSTITATIKNDNNQPLVSEEVIFISTSGLIQASAVTNSEGKATSYLISDRRNTVSEITIYLKNNPDVRTKLNVEFSGVSLSAAASPTSIDASGKDTSDVTVNLLDAMDNPIAGEHIKFQAQQSSVIYAGDDSIPTTDTRGNAYFKVFGNGVGTDTITFDAANASTDVILNYSNKDLTVTPDAAAGEEHTLVANGIDSTRFLIRYRENDKTTPIEDARCEVSVTMGSIQSAADTVFADTLRTNSNGKAYFYLNNPDFSNTAVVSVKAYSGNEITTAACEVYFRSDTVSYIELKGTPEVISTDGDEAKISATVFDSRGNRVKDEGISFNMISGPGGGEYLDPPTAVTGTDGVAVTHLVSGGSPSNYKDVWIVASSYSNVKSDTVKFTIAGPPKYITIRTNIEKGHNPNDGTFGLPCAAIVTDVNGNPVADGTEVTFSLKISAFVYKKPSVKWEAVSNGTDYNAVVESVKVILPFEDFNDNYSLDPGEDRNGDGVANRGEDIDGDGKFITGPAFYDINMNGRRDYLPTHITEPYITFQRNDTMVTRYVDYNSNGVLDMSEPLVDESITDSAYTAMLDEYKANHIGMGYDYDSRPENGVPDPNTSVAITRTVQTNDGKALNEIVYGQSDANKIQVMIWAESQGVVTKTPEQILLPIVID